MTQGELTALIIWLVESQSLGEERARALLFRILQELLRSGEKTDAKSAAPVYNHRQEGDERE